MVSGSLSVSGPSTVPIAVMFLPFGSTPSLMGFAALNPSYTRSSGANTLRANPLCDPAALADGGRTLNACPDTC
jgi:hypothetical protein